MFTLDPRLEQSSFWVCDFTLCQLRLINDSQYPWLILVPEVENIRDTIDLGESEQIQLCKESARVSGLLRTIHQPDKINVASIGNIVAQCHIHHIARWSEDVAWPNPVWGQHPQVAYDRAVADRLISQYQLALK